MKHTIHLVKWRNKSEDAKKLPNIDVFHSLNEANKFERKMVDRGCEILAAGKVTL